MKDETIITVTAYDLKLPDPGETIATFCEKCSRSSQVDVKECDRTNCPLHQYRLGRRVKTTVKTTMIAGSPAKLISGRFSRILSVGKNIWCKPD